MLREGKGGRETVGASREKGEGRKEKKEREGG